MIPASVKTFYCRNKQWLDYKQKRSDLVFRLLGEELKKEEEERDLKKKKEEEKKKREYIVWSIRRERQMAQNAGGDEGT